MSRREVCKISGILLVAGITYGMLHRSFYIERMLKRGAETRLNAEGQPYLLALKGPQFKDRDLALLKTIPSLERVHLQGSSITDAGIASLEEISDLVELDLSNTRVTNQSLSQLSRFSNLRSLHLDGCNGITLSGLRQLAALPALKHVSLVGVPLTYHELIQLDQQLPATSVLVEPGQLLGLTPNDPLLAEWRKQEYRMAMVAPEGRIVDRSIRLSVRSDASAEVTAQCLRSIGAPEAVVEMDLADVRKMSLDAFEELHRFTSLTSLRVWSVVDDAALASIARHESIRCLRIDSPGVTDQGLLEIPPDRPWVVLSVTGWNVTGSGLSALRHCPRLRSLSLNCPNLEPSSLKAVRLVKNLESFRVAGGGLSSHDVRFLIQQPRLEHIELIKPPFPESLQLAARSVWQW